jgi:WD40 repeat protein
MVEIIHESLLANWPRLVRWQTQDADSARLRDELRQAARTWDEHERSTDYLWTGRAFREYSVWREAYSGGLSELEEQFSRATTAHAKRRKRRRRMVTAAAFIVLLGVLGVVSVSRQQAIAEADRAEAAKLVALGTMAFEFDRTEGLAHAIASLERADTQEGRRLALRSLWAGPPAILLPDPPTSFSGPALPARISPHSLAISPDGRFLAAGYMKGVLRVFPRDGGEPLTLQAFDEDQGFVRFLFFSADGSYLVGGADTARGEVRVWETEAWELEHVLKPPEPAESLVAAGGWSVGYGLVEPDRSSVLTVVFQPAEGEDDDTGRWLLRRWPLDGGPSQLVGEAEGLRLVTASLDLARGLLASGLEMELQLHRLDTLGREPPRIIGRHSDRIGYRLAFDPMGELLVACDAGGVLRMWPTDGDGWRPQLELETTGTWGGIAFNPDGSRLVHGSGSGAWQWDLQGPSFGEPQRFGIRATDVWEVAFTPDGRWLAMASEGHQPYRLTLWPLSNKYPRVLRTSEGSVGEPVFFHPDCSRVFTSIELQDDSWKILSWPLTGGVGIEPTEVFEGRSVTMDRQGRFLVARDWGGGLWKVPLDGSPPVLLGIEDSWSKMDLDPTGRYLAGLLNTAQDNWTVWVFDFETGELVEIEPPGEGSTNSRYFDSAGRLLMARDGVLSRWDRATRATEVLFDEGVPFARPIGDGSRVWVGWEGTGYRSILDLEDGLRQPFPQAHQQLPSVLMVDQSGSIVVSGHSDGDVRVGPVFGEEVHLLLGHSESFANVDAISPDGKWIASIDDDGSVYVWPMPDFSKRPFHLLPYGELMTRLKALTNFRAVPDPEARTGYTVQPDFEAYRGWAEVPEW